MKIHIKIAEATTIFIYIMVVFIYMICISLFDLNNTANDYDNLRYFAFTFAIFAGYCALWKQRKVIQKKEYLFGIEIKYIYVLVVILYSLSVIQARKVEHAIGIRTYVQLALILIPAMYSYCLVNLLSIRTIIELFEITLIFAIIFYFIEEDMESFLLLESWKSISIKDSYSPFENSHYSEVFLNLFFFFNYFRHYETDQTEKIKLNCAYIASILFTLLSFKRLAIAAVFGILLLNIVLDVKKELPVQLPFIIAIVFTFATILYTRLMQGTLFEGFDVYKFSTGRDYILSLWANKGYLSYGYGSSLEVIGRYLEMDLVQIYLEVGWIAVFLFSYCYFQIAGKSLYAYIVMLYVFLNLLTASSIPFSLGWILTLVTLACIASDKVENEQIHIRRTGLLVKYKGGRIKWMS